MWLSSIQFTSFTLEKDKSKLKASRHKIIIRIIIIRIIRIIRRRIKRRLRRRRRNWKEKQKMGGIIYEKRERERERERERGICFHAPTRSRIPLHFLHLLFFAWNNSANLDLRAIWGDSWLSSKEYNDKKYFLAAEGHRWNNLGRSLLNVSPISLSLSLFLLGKIQERALPYVYNIPASQSKTRKRTGALFDESHVSRIWRLYSFEFQRKQNAWS